jgi:hypothetical protein
MKLNKWKAPILVLGWLVVIVLTILFFYKPVRFIGSIIKESVKDRQRLLRLLSETDHQALLEACREISKEVTTDNLAPNRYIVRYKPDPEISRFPQIILDIEPLCIDIYNDGRVSLEMTGAIHHRGVTAYPENYEKPSDNFTFGDKKIIDGLWYYEDHYNPKYDDKRIESMLKKGKRSREN